MQDKGKIYFPVKTEQDSERFHCATQNSAQFKIYKLFISVIFHLVFLDHVWPYITEIVEIETMDKQEGDYCNF